MVLVEWPTRENHVDSFINAVVISTRIYKSKLISHDWLLCIVWMFGVAFENCYLSLVLYPIIDRFMAIYVELSIPTPICAFCKLFARFGPNQIVNESWLLKPDNMEPNTCTVYSFIKCMAKMMRNSLGKVFSLSKMVQRNVHVCPINIVGWFFFGAMLFSVNVRTPKFTWIAWNFNGLNGIQSTSRLLKRHTKIGQEPKLYFYHCFWSENGEKRFFVCRTSWIFRLFFHMTQHSLRLCIRT